MKFLYLTFLALLFSFTSFAKIPVIDLGEWSEAYDDTIPRINRVQSQQFNEFESFYYLQSIGDTAVTVIKDSIWTDNYNNGKYQSVCKFRWTSPYDFELELISTNEPSRIPRFSPGKILHYRIISKTDDYFLINFNVEEVSYQFMMHPIRRKSRKE